MKKTLIYLICLCSPLLIGSMFRADAQVIEDFESTFVPASGYGSIPANWQVSGSELTDFSQSTDAQHGAFSLHAIVGYDPSYYTVLERTFGGFEPGQVFDVEILVKVSTSSRAECALGVKQGWTETTTHWNERTRYWYHDSDFVWTSLKIEDVSINSEGNLILYLKFGNDGGISDFFLDNLTLIEPDSANQALPLPSSQEYFPLSPKANYSTSQNPSLANPMGLGNCVTGGQNLNLEIGFEEFQAPVDIYFAVSIPDPYSENLFVLQPDHSLKPISEGLIPWRTGITFSISESIFEGIPTAMLPSGDYIFYLAVTPSNETTFNHYYLWQTSITINNNKSPTPGEWSGDAGFGNLGFVVAPAGNEITEISFTFENFRCGSVIRNGTIKVSKLIPINTNQFSSNTLLSPNFEMTLIGNFEGNATLASGTFEAVSYNETCSGTWEASPY